MTYVISVTNLKGGVGKTAIAVNLAAFCGLSGHNTLLVDLDPQTNATFSCIEVDEWEKHAKEHGTIANLLGFRPQAYGEHSVVSISDIIRPKVFSNVDLIPSHLDLYTIDLDMGGATGREFRLKRAIQPVIDQYQFIVCDCPPNLTIPTQNALCASTHYIVPISPDYLSGIGVGILLSRVRQFCLDINHNSLKLAGMVISRVGRRAEHREETIAALRARFGDDVLKVQINERVAVSEAAAKKHSIFEHDDPIAAREFKTMSEEIISRVG
jgi:chromosome partitioning protein